MKSPLSWEAFSNTLAPLGYPKIASVTQGWAPMLSGLGLLSGHGSKRLYQLTWKAMCAGAMWLDRLPALGLGFRAPGVQGKDSSRWGYQESRACHCLTCSWGMPCLPQTVQSGGWPFPRSSVSGKALSVALKMQQLPGHTEKGQPRPLDSTSGSEGPGLWEPQPSSWDSTWQLDTWVTGCSLAGHLGGL